MLDVLDGIDVPVDIHIVIKSIDGANQLGLVRHLHSPTLVNGTLLVLDYPVINGAIINGKDIGGLTAFRVYHSPDRATVTVNASIIANDGKITAGKIAHSRFNPCLDIELGVLLGHLVHLDSQTRQYPRPIDGH